MTTSDLRTGARATGKWLAVLEGSASRGLSPGSQITDAGTVPERVCPGVHPIIPVTASPWARRVRCP